METSGQTVRKGKLNRLRKIPLITRLILDMDRNKQMVQTSGRTQDSKTSVDLPKQREREIRQQRKGGRDSIDKRKRKETLRTSYKGRYKLELGKRRRKL